MQLAIASAEGTGKRLHLTTLYAAGKDRRHKANGTAVRVIEYVLGGISDPEASYRLITSWGSTPPPHRRLSWPLSITAAGRLSRSSRSPRGIRDVILRSKRPELAEQEFLRCCSRMPPFDD